METACEKPKNSITGSLIGSGLFDSKWYLERYSWVEKERNIPIIHYVESGEVNNRLPNEYFHPTWYRKKYLADMHGVTNCLLHYFQIGRFKGFAPSPYFDTEAYAAAIGSDLRPENALEYWLAGDRQVAPPANDKLVLEVEIEKTGLFLAHWYKKQYLQNDHDTISPIEHYCTIGAVEGHKPNPYFDPIWYLAANPHVAESGEDPLIHYAMHGWRNGKIPSHRFDAQKYLAENTMLNSANSVEYEPLNHYLYCTDKNNDGQDMVSISEFTGYIDKPSVGCNEIFRDFLSEPGFRLIRYYAGSVALEKEVRKKFSLELELILKKSELHWLRQLESLELLAAMYHPVNDSGLYSEAVLIDFLLFLRNFDNDISIPTGIYDPNIYREITGSTSSDAACLKELQWVYGGMYENICNGNLIALNYIKTRLNCEEGANIFASYLVARGVAFNRRYETLEKDRKEHLGAQIISEYFRYHSDLDLWDRLKCGQLSKQIFAAAEYDSKILERGLDIGISRPPFNTVLASIVRRVRIELPRKKYDTVILIPHCRMSGATKIAGKFADALVTLGIDESILIVITDLDINIHPEWFPHGVDVFSLANVNSGLEKTQKESALYDLLIGVRPRRVVNFNSALGWDVFEIYGKRLATQQSLSAYLFCYDLNKDEVKVGYPSRYFVSSLSYLDKVMFDS